MTIYAGSACYTPTDEQPARQPELQTTIFCDHVNPKSSHVLAALRIGGGRTAGRLAICTRRQLLTIWYGRTAGRLPVRGFWRQLLTISVAALLADLLTVKPTRGDVGSNDKLTKRRIRTTKGTTRRRSID